MQEIRCNDNQEEQPFFVKYISPREAESLREEDRLLALIHYVSPENIPALPPNDRYLSVPLEPLGMTGNNDSCIEAWFSRDASESGFEDGIAYAITEDYLFGYLQLDEDSFSELKTLGYDLYQRILRFIEKRDYPYILRAWNYISDITGLDHDLERYQAFCAGRHDAFKSITSFENILPAASAIGTSSSGYASIYFIAASEKGIQIENPRQVSAFRYPPQYGERSPSFSRAIFKKWGEHYHVYVSGTASVVGHETKHAGNVQLQLEETLRNIEALLGTLSEKEQLHIDWKQDLSMLKIYIRNREDYESIRKYVESVVGNDVPCLYLEGDICRSDLLLEIEALYFK
ncbi:chorismate transformation enzyme, FkbO/Hyg5 family [Kaarinaea lacus]